MVQLQFKELQEGLVIYDTKRIINPRFPNKKNVPKKQRIWAIFNLNEKSVEEITFYRPPFTEHEGLKLVEEFINTSWGQQFTEETKKLVALENNPDVITLSEFFANKDLYKKSVCVREESNGKKKKVEVIIPKSISVGPKLKFAALKCEDDSDIVTYMIFDKNYKNESSTKKSIRTWATLICDLNAETLKEVHYHKWSYKNNPNGIDLVRECIKDHEWEITSDTKEIVRVSRRINNKWTTVSCPLEEFVKPTE